TTERWAGEFSVIGVDPRRPVRRGGDRNAPEVPDRSRTRRTTMAQYLLSVWHDEDYSNAFETTPPEVIERLHAQVGALNADMEKKRAWVFGGGLVPASSATVVRPGTDGDVSITDGPYAEAKIGRAHV